MNCPRCRGGVPAGAAFCPNCGNDLRAFQQPQSQKTSENQTQMAPPGYYQGQTVHPQVAKKSNTGKVIAGIAALVLILLGLFAYNLLKQTAKQEPSSVLAKTGTAPPPALQQTAKAEPVLKQTAEAPKQMPEDIYKWLEHLRKTEIERGKLARKGLSELMVMSQTAQLGLDLDGLKQLAQGDPDAPEPKTSADRIGESAAQTRAKWKELQQFFESYPPPQECIRIRDNYSSALSETGGMISDVLDAVVMSKDDPNKAIQALTGMQNTSKTIDEAGAATNEGVIEICQKYDTRPWFKIENDFGNTSLFGAFGTR